MRRRKGETMKQGSTLLKVVSIILIVFAALAVVGGILMIAGGGIIAGSGASGTYTINGTTYSGTEAAVGGGLIIGALGGVMMVSGIIDLIIGIVGVKASNENGQHTAAFVLGIIGVIVAAAGLIMGIANNSSSIFSGLVGLVLPILYLVGVMQTRKQFEESVPPQDI